MNYKKRFNTFCFIWISCISFTGFGQQRDYITGKILDAETDEPVAFVSIRIKDRALGVISNIDGGFKIPLKYKKYGTIIEISSMGYQVLEIDLNGFNLTEDNLLKLKPNIEILDEVVLVSEKRKSKSPKKKELKAKDIVRKAIHGIARNYPKTPFSYIGYYRDYQVRNQKRFNFNEAIFEVFDNGFQTNDYQKTNHKLYQYTRNTTFPIDDSGQKPYDNKSKFIPGAEIQTRQGNELLILRNMDAIRNYNRDTYSFVNQFENDFINNHWFEKIEDVELGAIGLYAIVVSKRTSSYLVFGKIFISKTSFAIHKFNYEVFERDLIANSNADYDDLKKEVKPLFAVSIGYSERNGLMYPSYISFNNQFVTYGNPKFKIEEVFLNSLEQCVVVRFSSEPSAKDIQKTKLYSLRYDDEEIKIAHIAQMGKLAKLYFSESTWEDLQSTILAKKTNGGNMDYDKLDLSVTKMKDIHENDIDVSEEITFTQFREFFIQKVKFDANSFPESGFMKKDRPIFKNQPTSQPDNFNDYWMNTPLQNIEN